MVVKVSIADFRSNLLEHTGRVQFAGERIILTKHGKHTVAVVSLEDLERLEAIDAATAEEKESIAAIVHGGRRRRRS